jgi:8-oxo-dGTP diphosphatase
MLKVCRTLYGKQKLVTEKELVARHAGYALIIKNHQMLLVNTKSTNKLWFPGGVVEKGETEKDALEREVYEETGLTITSSTFFSEVESYFYYDPQKVAFHQYSRFYLCEVAEGEVSDKTNADTEDEAEKPQWVNVSSLHEDSFQDYGFQIFSLMHENVCKN